MYWICLLSQNHPLQMCLLSAPLSPASKSHIYSFLLAKQINDWRRKGSIVSFLFQDSNAGVAPQHLLTALSRRGNLPVQRMHIFPIRHSCHTPVNILVCKQIICSSSVDAEMGEGKVWVELPGRSQAASGNMTPCLPPARLTRWGSQEAFEPVLVRTEQSW